ncbi:MAG: hypothetical protein WAO35_18060, partial [Terriglobia bacterium]
MTVLRQRLARQDFKRVRLSRRLFLMMRRREPAVPTASLAEIRPAAMPTTATTLRIKGPTVVRLPGTCDRRGRRLRQS